MDQNGSRVSQEMVARCPEIPGGLGQGLFSDA